MSARRREIPERVPTAVFHARGAVNSWVQQNGDALDAYVCRQNYTKKAVQVFRKLWIACRASLFFQCRTSEEPLGSQKVVGPCATWELHPVTMSLRAQRSKTPPRGRKGVCRLAALWGSTLKDDVHRPLLEYLRE